MSSLSIAEKVNLPFQDVERFIPIVTMRRACSLFALLQGDPVALRRFVGRQYRQRVPITFKASSC